MRAGQCLLRASPDQPLRWLAWDGSAFAQDIGSPYGARSRSDCTQVLVGNVMSLKYIPRLSSFVALMLTRDGVEYATSPDLLHWSGWNLLTTFVSLADFKRGHSKSSLPEWYFSLLDPTSKSPNFDTLEERPYLYFVRFHVENGKLQNRKRDLMRMPLRITEGPAAP
jgi:hypothetical protein